MNASYNTNWNAEYGDAKGIPSSHRATPSSAVCWGVEAIEQQGKSLKGMTALDVGCGAGRNSFYMIEQGLDVTAFDGSEVAIETAKQANSQHAQRFRCHELNKGLPVDKASCDLVTDIFVYKHQLDPDQRAAYRAEMARVLKPEGYLLLSLADKADSYYSNCPVVENADPRNPMTIIDPPVQIGSVLFALEDLETEFSDYFKLEKSTRKVSVSPMHGKEYERTVLTTLWRLKL